MTLYEKLKKAGCEIDNHCSDLYVKKTPISTSIIEKAKKEVVGISTFMSAIDGSVWYDIPFMYDPLHDLHD